MRRPCRLPARTLTIAAHRAARLDLDWLAIATAACSASVVQTVGRCAAHSELVAWPWCTAASLMATTVRAGTCTAWPTATALAGVVMPDELSVTGGPACFDLPFVPFLAGGGGAEDINGTPLWRGGWEPPRAPISASPGASGVRARLLCEARKTRISVVMLVQRPEANLIGGTERSQMGLRIAFRLDGPDSVKMAVPEAADYAAEHASALPGVALAAVPGRGLVRLRAPFLGYSDYTRLVAR